MTKGKFILPMGGAGGKTAEFQVSGGWLQWRYADQSPADTWKDLIEIPSDGKSPEMQYHNGWFQWRYAGQTPEDTWKNLVEISLDGDFTINEYGYWQLTVDLTEKEIDDWYEDVDVERPTDGNYDPELNPKSVEINSTEHARFKGHGTVKLILESLEKRLWIIGAKIEFKFEENWLYYRYVYDPLPDAEDADIDADLDAGWMPIMEIVIPDYDGDFESGEDGKTPELRENEGWVQWRYADQSPEDTWQNLFQIPEGGEGGDGTTITGFNASVAAGTRPTPGNNQTVRLRITESNATTHDVFLGGQAGLNFWHGDQAAYDTIAASTAGADPNTVYYINEP